MRMIDADRLQRDMVNNADGDMQDDYELVDNQPTVEIPHWHNLMENPEDLPKKSCYVLVKFDDPSCVIEIMHYNSIYGFEGFYNPYTERKFNNVIKWCELPEDG